MPDLETPPRPPETLPRPTAFRAWVTACLAELGITATGFATAEGLGKNSVSTFLSDPTRDIRLGNAAEIARALAKRGAQEQVDLPRLDLDGIEAGSLGVGAMTPDCPTCPAGEKTDG